MVQKKVGTFPLGGGGLKILKTFPTFLNLFLNMVWIIQKWRNFFSTPHITFKLKELKETWDISDTGLRKRNEDWELWTGELWTGQTDRDCQSLSLCWAKKTIRWTARWRTWDSVPWSNTHKFWRWVTKYLQGSLKWPKLRCKSEVSLSELLSIVINVGSFWELWHKLDVSQSRAWLYRL